MSRSETSVNFLIQSVIYPAIKSFVPLNDSSECISAVERLLKTSTTWKIAVEVASFFAHASLDLVAKIEFKMEFRRERTFPTLRKGEICDVGPEFNSHFHELLSFTFGTLNDSLRLLLKNLRIPAKRSFQKIVAASKILLAICRSIKAS